MGKPPYISFTDICQIVFRQAQNIGKDIRIMIKIMIRAIMRVAAKRKLTATFLGDTEHTDTAIVCDILGCHRLGICHIEFKSDPLFGGLIKKALKGIIGNHIDENVRGIIMATDIKRMRHRRNITAEGAIQNILICLNHKCNVFIVVSYVFFRHDHMCMRIGYDDKIKFFRFFFGERNITLRGMIFRFTAEIKFDIGLMDIRKRFFQFGIMFIGMCAVKASCPGDIAITEMVTEPDLGKP